MREFKGRVVTPGTVSAEAVVTHEGFNTLASLQKALQFGDKTVTVGDQNNKDLYGKSILGKALCLPQTIGSTTGGMVLYCACAMERVPACLLFSNHIDSLAAAGAILADVWLDNITMPVVDGVEALKMIKALDGNAKVVMVTAAGQKNKMIDCIKAGANEFLTKPFDQQEILDVIAKMV